MKLSPFVLTVARLRRVRDRVHVRDPRLRGARPFCLLQLVTFTLGLGRAAAIGACVVWLLTGFGASDINSATGAPYLLFPVLLYTLVVYQRRAASPASSPR